jgi:HAD superfamily hydrolase (TIGR01509 family)
MLRGVLFDWDGTLADTAEASYRCYVRMFSEFSIPFDRDIYARTYSPNWYHTFRALGLEEQHWEHADKRWLDHFADEQVELLDGARHVVESLTSRGLAVGIVTSGSRVRVERELELHGLAEHVQECVFGSELQHKKPHPEGLLLCLERMKLRADEALFVGDSPEDIDMARAAGVFSVAVTGGYPNLDALLASKPDAFAESIRALLDIVDAR